MREPFFSTFGRVVPASLMALFAASLFVSAVAFCVSAVLEEPSVGRLLLAASDTVLATTIAFAVGLVPTLLVGAPLYAALVASHRSSYAAAGLIGLVPVIPLLFVALQAGLFAAYSVPVALLTHRLYSRTYGKAPHA